MEYRFQVASHRIIALPGSSPAYGWSSICFQYQEHNIARGLCVQQVLTAYIPYPHKQWTLEALARVREEMADTISLSLEAPSQNDLQIARHTVDDAMEELKEWKIFCEGTPKKPGGAHGKGKCCQLWDEIWGPIK